MEPIRTHRNENIMKVEIFGVRLSLISARDPDTYLFLPHFSCRFSKALYHPSCEDKPVFSNQPEKSCYVAFLEQHTSLGPVEQKKKKYNHTQSTFARIHHCYFFPSKMDFFPLLYLSFLLLLLTLGLKVLALIT